MSARLVASGQVRRHDAAAAGAQLAGAAAVAVLATIPLLLLPDSAEYDVVRIVLACFIAVVAFAVARKSAAGRGRALLYGGSILVVALAVAILKNVLSGH